MTIALFHEASSQCSRLITGKYSTSFASAIRLLHVDLRNPVYNIYGMVRFADEIVDTFHGHDQAKLLADFKRETFDAIDRGISLNPILNAFQLTVNKYNIDLDLVHAFFNSMESDLTKTEYDHDAYAAYIYGSAEVVGLMCLYVFCEGDKEKYLHLRDGAQALGAAFQKVNFLRDIRADHNELSRMYFPGCNFLNFTAADKQQIESEIELDFKNAFSAILQLPLKARFGVYVAYKYYYSLFRKIKSARASQILQQRFRIGNHQKAMIVFRAGVKMQLKLL